MGVVCINHTQYWVWFVLAPPSCIDLLPLRASTSPSLIDYSYWQCLRHGVMVSLDASLILDCVSIIPIMQLIMHLLSIHNASYYAVMVHMNIIIYVLLSYPLKIMNLIIFYLSVLKWVCLIHLLTFPPTYI